MRLKLTITIEEGDDASRIQRLSRIMLEWTNNYVTGDCNTSFSAKGDHVSMQVVGAVTAQNAEDF